MNGKKLMALFMVLAAVSVISSVVHAWWDTNWGYRVPVTITEQSGSDLTDYQAYFTLDTASLISAGKMNSDCSDLRVVDSDDLTALSFWIEDGTCNTASTKVWVKIPSLLASSSKTIYAYYGNPTATSASSITNTFILGDDFNDGTLAGTTIDGTWSETGGEIGQTSDTTTGYDNSYDMGALSVTDNIEFVAKARTTASNVGWVGIAFASGSSTYVDGVWDIYGNLARILEISSDSISQDTSNSATLDETTYQELRLVKTGTSYTFYVGGIASPTITSSLAITNAYLNSRRASDYYDWAFVKKYASSEPTSTVGAEETNTATNNPPTQPSLSVSPSPAYVGDTLTATASGSTDADGDTITYEYKFVRQSDSYVLQDWSSTNTYTITTGEAHDAVIVYARAYDGTDYSTEASQTVTIENTLPTAPSLSLSPADVYVGTTITATASGSSDADGDAITYEYKFVKDSDGTILQDWSTTNTYTVTANEAHDTIDVYARAYDGYGYSSETSQSTAVLNSAPSVDSLSLSPSPVYVGDVLTATATCSDADNDATTTYYEFVNTDDNVIVQDWSTDNTYTIQQSDAHDGITVYAKCDDGTVNSTEASASITISNTAPTAPASLTATDAVIGYNITATASGSTDADGDAITYYYQFYDVNDSSILQDWSTSNTYLVPDSMLGKTLRIYAKAGDGYDNSTSSYIDKVVTNITIEITSPTNSTYLTNEIWLNFTVSDNNPFTCDIYKDGSLVASTNNSAYSSLYSFATAGSHYFNVSCSDSNGVEFADVVHFTLRFDITCSLYDEITKKPLQGYCQIYNESSGNYVDEQWLELDHAENYDESCAHDAGADNTCSVTTNSGGTIEYTLSDGSSLYIDGRISIPLGIYTVFGGEETSKNSNVDVFEASIRLEYDGDPTSYETLFSTTGESAWNTKFEVIRSGDYCYVYINNTLSTGLTKKCTNPRLQLRVYLTPSAYTASGSIKITGFKTGGGNYTWSNIMGTKWLTGHSDILYSGQFHLEYPPRSIYTTNSILNSRIYLLSTLKGVYATVLAKSIDGAALRQKILQFYRDDPTGRTELFECKTDDAGQCIVFVDPSAAYIVKYYETGQERIVRFASGGTYTIAFGDTSFYTPEKPPRADCEVTNSSVNCTIDSDYIYNFMLIVKHSYNWTEEQLCNETGTFDDGSLGCDIGVNSGAVVATLYYNYDFDTNESKWITLANEIYFIPETKFGDVGKVMVLAMLLISGAATVVSPLMGMIMMVVTSFAGFALGLIPSSSGTWIALLFIIGISLYKVMKG